MYKIDNKNLRAKIINLFLKSMVCFSGCLMSSASLQKLFCGVCSALKCSFEEFVREKVVFPSYSSAIFFLQLKIFKSIALNGRIVFEEDQFLLIEEECEKRVKQKRQVAERTGNSVFRLKGPHTDCTFSLHFLHYCVHIRPLTQFL